MKVKTLIWRIALIACLLSGGSLLLARIDEVGNPINLFSQQRCFAGEGPLSSDLAIDLAQRTFKADGIELGTLKLESVHIAPSRAVVYFKEEARNGWGYDVIIRQDGSRFRCRALRPK
jgi:hypothetical protein